MSVCDYCGAALDPYVGRGRPRRFCSDRCCEQLHREPLRLVATAFALRRSRYERRKKVERSRGCDVTTAHLRAMAVWPWPDSGEPWTAYLARVGWLDREDA